MQEAYRDKETEYNWEARDKALTRLRGILRGNASDKYHDSLMLGVRQMVDGILKAVSLFSSPESFVFIGKRRSFSFRSKVCGRRSP